MLWARPSKSFLFHKEEGETSSSEWRDVEAEGRHLWSGLDAFFEKYCERMLSFDRLAAQQLKEIEESCLEGVEEQDDGDDDDDDDDEEEGETSSSEWRDVEAEGRRLWSGLDAFFEKYCERMLSFDRLVAQQLKEIGPNNHSTPSLRSVSKKLASPFRCLFLKKIEELEDETEHLQQPKKDLHEDLETAYVAQLYLTWEALNCQYTQLSQKISCMPDDPTCYNHSAQLFQQFQVLLQRYMENEPFDHGFRPEIYSRTRISLPKLLQVPNVIGSAKRETTQEDSDMLVLAPNLIRVFESSIFTFHLFLKMDKKKSGVVRNVFGGQNQMAIPLQQI